MFPTPTLRFRRPLTPVLERGEYSPSPPGTETTCTFDPSMSMPISDPEVTQLHVTSSQADQMNACLTDHLLYGDVHDIVEEIRDSPRAKFHVSELQSLCEIYAETRRAIVRLEVDLVKIKKKLKQSSDDFACNHERMTSATSRHRLQKGLREVADEKATTWRQHCQNLELGYCQERPQLEQMKTVSRILKASVSELEESNKYLTTFLGVMKKKRLKLYEQQYLEHIRNNPARSASQHFRQEFEDTLRNQLDVKNLGNPSYRKYLNYHELMKRFGRNLPRPPFAPHNVFKLKTLSSFVGKSSLQYGHGQVCTLKIDLNKQMLGDEGTFGRVSPEAKENWVLAGRKCLNGDKEQELVEESLCHEGIMGYSRLPAIGTNQNSDPFKTWMPRKSFVRHFPSPDITQTNPNGFRGMKYPSTSNIFLRSKWRTKSSASLVTLNTWSDGIVTEQENTAVTDPLHGHIGIHAVKISGKGV